MSTVKPFKKQSPLKSFNVVTAQPLQTRVHPCVVFTILDAFVRRPENTTRAIGTLLGYVAEGNVVEITDAFTVVHQESAEKVLMDQDYHRQMVKLRQKVSPKEQVIGWFCTGSEIQDASVIIHNFYLKYNESGFQPSSLLSSPIHMIVDTDLTNDRLAIKAYLNKDTSVAEHLVQFHEIPLIVESLDSEKSGIAMLLRAREGKSKDTMLSSTDAFTQALDQLNSLFTQVKKYVQDVKEGKIKGDPSIGRDLTKVLCAEQFLNAEAFENLTANSLQDTLMVVYLSNLTRTQITLAEKINNAYSRE